MAKRSRKRFGQIGCLAAILTGAGIFLWVLASTPQTPTAKIVTQRTVASLYGPLEPNDAGVVAFWDELVAKLRGNGVPLERAVQWLGVPRELTVAFYEAQPTPLVAVAINFGKGYRWLWMLLRVFGKHYKSAHYFSSHRFTVGMFGGTAILARDETTFCYAVENLALSGRGENPKLNLTQRLRNRYDFVGFIKPQLLPIEGRLRLPASLGEIGVDILDANELKGSVFWICQSEREAEAMVKALERIESELAADCESKGAKCSFRKQRESVFVWWEFRLTNFTALLF